MSDSDPAALRNRVRACLLMAACAGLLALSAGPVALPLRLEPVDGGPALQIQAGPPLTHLVFFATWCPPCVDELPALADLDARFASSGYRLVLIAVPVRQTKQRLAAFVEESKPPGELLFDADGAAQKALGVERLPGHVLLDAAGTVTMRSPKLDAALQAEIERVLARGRTRSPR